MNELKHLTFGASYKSDDATGTVEAIVSVFGVVDSYKERVMPGAYSGSLGKKLPRCVWSHNWDEPIAKTLEARELMPGDMMLPESLRELGGLYVKGQFFQDIEDSWQAYLKIKNGLIDEFSIGYRLLKYAVNDETGVWDLLEIDLTEWSPVIKGACPGTKPVSVKSVLSDASGLSLEEHTSAVLDAADGLIKRWQETAELRGEKATATFKSRLRAVADSFSQLADKAKALDAEVPATTLSLDWEKSRHEATLRAIRLEQTTP